MIEIPAGKKLVSKWYYGGVAAVGAACCTHPLDLIKVHIQTQQGGAKIGVLSQAALIIKRDGIFALYAGLTGSILRQLTYSTTRFGLFEIGKQRLTPKGKRDFPIGEKILLAGFSGAIGGFVGTPGDVVNVRMQNDVKLAPELRRNYKHAIDGVMRVIREEGIRKLFSGATFATFRAAVMNVGQLGVYDQVKNILLDTNTFKDNFGTHFLSSLTAGATATFMTQPFDVMKTRLMNAKPGEFRGLLQVFTYTAQLGPQGFFKGFIPSFVRLGPHTIIMFMLMEQLRQNFGVLVDQ